MQNGAERRPNAAPKRLLSQREAAAHLGIGVKRFRALCKSGRGPAEWSPDNGRPMWAVVVLDEWVQTSSHGAAA